MPVVVFQASKTKLFSHTAHSMCLSYTLLTACIEGLELMTIALQVIRGWSFFILFPTALNCCAWSIQQWRKWSIDRRTICFINRCRKDV